MQAMTDKLLPDLPEPEWVSVEDRLPPHETPVLIVKIGQGVIRIGELRWDYPSFEDTYSAYRYWDDPYDEGQDWQWDSVTHWMPLPAAPTPQQEEKP